MIRLILFLSVLCLAAAFDIRTRMIPDWIHLLIVIVSLLPPGSVHYTGVLAMLPLLFIGITYGGIGGGDIKLVGACGLVLGLTRTYIGLIMGLCFLLVFHAGNMVFHKAMKKEIAAKEQAYPLVPFLLSGMAASVWIGG